MGLITMTNAIVEALKSLSNGKTQFVGPDGSISRYVAQKLESAGYAVWTRGRAWDVGASRIVITEAGRAALSTVEAKGK
jgi:ribosomal protein S19E (S16A)